MSDLPIMAWVGIISIWVITAFNVRQMIKDYRKQIKEINRLMDKV